MKPDLTIVAAAPKGGGEQAVPLGALAMPDDQQQMTPPAAGDVVTYEVQGKVQRVEGETAYVAVEKVNGQDVPEAEEGPEKPDGDEAGEENEAEANEFAALKGDAEQMGPMQ